MHAWIWMGALFSVLLIVAIVANFNVGHQQFKVEMKDHWDPTQPLDPHQNAPLAPVPSPVPPPAAAADAPAAGGVKGPVANLEQVYNEVARTISQITVSIVGEQRGGGGSLVNQIIGSGLMVGKGHVLTNYHVVENVPALSVTVHEPFRASYPTQVAQLDPANDLALLKIGAAVHFPSAPIGDAHSVDAGDIVFAVGSPLGVGNTISTGIISDTHKTITLGGRTYSDLLQTTTPIYLGSSGGPLVNLSGQIIGINTIIYAPEGHFTGISFAIPINHAYPLLQWIDPLLVQNHRQPLRLATGAGCAITPNSPNCFVPAAAPVPLLSPPSEGPSAGNFSPAPPLAATLLRCPACNLFHHPRCGSCGRRMVLDSRSTQLRCPLGHGISLGYHRCPNCGGAVVPHSQGGLFSLA
jgi:S1-C subfamily serine protease